MLRKSNNQVIKQLNIQTLDPRGDLYTYRRRNRIASSKMDLVSAREKKEKKQHEEK